MVEYKKKYGKLKMPVEAVNDKDIVTSFIKGLKVIMAFDNNNVELSVSDVAKKVDITRASARRLLLTLESLGYVTSNDNKFSLLPKVIELGYSYFSSLPWTDLALKNMKEVVSVCKLTCSVSIIDKENITCILRIPAGRIMNEGIQVGTRLPTAYTSTGRLFMAHMPEDKLKEFIDELPLVAYTKRSITNPTRLYEKILSEKNQPYAMVEEEVEDGLISIAVPIYNK
ncbi:MAG: IclR family pca regulon transcriptional regulator, partial [Sulfurimonas sp.]